MKELTDIQLLERYQKNGEARVLGELFVRYSDLVYGLCLKYLKDRDGAQDAVMDIFEKLTGKLKTEQVAHFKSWLYIVSKNHCLMQLRKQKVDISGDLMEIPDLAHLKEEKLKMETDLKAMEACMETLNDIQKECVDLFYMQHNSYQQVSELTGYDLKSIKSHIQNGKRNLKICMEQKNERVKEP